MLFISYGLFHEKQPVAGVFSGLIAWQQAEKSSSIVWLGLGSDINVLYDEMMHDFQKRGLNVSCTRNDEQAQQQWHLAQSKPKIAFLYGTDFQKSVWDALLNIKKGQTCSYQDIAKSIGRPRAVRAVGGAVGANPISVFVPCHRVICADGRIHNYRWGTDCKLQLLQAEQADYKPKTSRMV